MEAFLGEWSGYSVSSVIVSRFALDGGAMCGPIPKSLWQKFFSYNEDNTLNLVTRSLLIEGNNNRILVDVGMGEIWNEKEKAIFHITDLTSHQLNLKPQHIILTHLHFDHAAGLSTISTSKEILSAFPLATLHLQKRNWCAAQTPHPKEKASYKKHIIDTFKHSTYRLAEGKKELFPHIFVHISHGHTSGLQWIEITDKNKGPLFFPSDLLPTAYHLHPVCHTSYDMNPRKSVIEKGNLLSRAVKEDALVIYQHDSKYIGSKVAHDQSGKLFISEPLLSP